MFLGYVQLGYVKKIDNKSYVLYVEELYLHPWFIHLISALKPPCFFSNPWNFPEIPGCVAKKSSNKNNFPDWYYSGSRNLMCL